MASILGEFCLSGLLHATATNANTKQLKKSAQCSNNFSSLTQHVSLKTIFSFINHTLKNSATFCCCTVFCTSWDGLRKTHFFRMVPTNTRVFCAQFMTIRERKILVKFYCNLKKKNVAKCNLGKVKIEACAGQQCPHGRDMRGWPPHFAGAPGFLQLTCLCQFISHLFTCRRLCCLSLLLPVPPTLW